MQYKVLNEVEVVTFLRQIFNLNYFYFFFIYYSYNKRDFL